MTKRPTFSQLIEHERTLYSRLGARRRAVTSLATVPGLQPPRAHEGRYAESASRFLDFVPHEDSPIKIDTARPWTYLTWSRSGDPPPGTLPRVSCALGHIDRTDRPPKTDNGHSMQLDDKFDDRVSNQPCAGHVAFDAYTDSVAGVAHTGRPIPPWHELPERIRAAWQVGVEAAIADEIGRGALARVASPAAAPANRG